MPKLRSHSGAKKRFKFTANGKIKHKKIGVRHLMTGDSGNEARRLRRTAVLDATDAKSIKKALPYG